jgi:hypothetical protein
MSSTVLGTRDAAADIGVSPWFLLELVRSKKVKKPVYEFGGAMAWQAHERQAVRDYLKAEEEERKRQGRKKIGRPRKVVTASDT